MSDQVQNLARMLTDKGPSAVLRIGTITAIQNVSGVISSGAKVQTDQTGTAWINRDQGGPLAVGDRVWMIQQGAVFVVAGRLSGEPSGSYVKSKTATQSVTSNATTPISDTDLFVDLQPGLYRIELVAHASCSLASPGADIKSAWTNTGTMTMLARSCVGPGPASTDTDATVTTAGAGMMKSNGYLITSQVLFGITPEASSVIREDIPLVVTAAGRLQWQWCQGTSSATATTVSSAGRIYVTPLQSL